MADLRTEEEQIEALKNWWAENGKSTIAGVVIALGGYFGWMGWDRVQESKVQAAADIYQQMQTLPDTSAEQVVALAEQLRQDYQGTAYAVFAGLELAKRAVTAKDYDRARELLIWTQAQKPDEAIAPLVALRLAQVEYAADRLDQALVALNQVSAGAEWELTIAEMRGDILLARGERDQARMQYQRAAELAASRVGVGSNTLQAKLDDLTVAAPADKSTEGDKS